MESSNLIGILVFAGLSLALVAGLKFAARRLETMPARDRRPAAMLVFSAASALSLALFFGLGASETIGDIRRYRNATHTADAFSVSYECLPGNRSALISYSFEAPEPGAGRMGSYHRQERVSLPLRARCNPHFRLPFTIWYDPADPQRATVDPPTFRRAWLPLLALAAGIGLLVLAPLWRGLRLLAGGGAPASGADAREEARMRAAGFVPAREPMVAAAVAGALARPASQRYARRIGGRGYLSLDFIAEPGERAAAEAALGRLQSEAGGSAGDAALVAAALERLRELGGSAP